MQRDGQFDHAQAGAEMAAGDRNDVDHLVAQLVGELAQLLRVQLAQVSIYPRRVNPSREVDFN